jgi:hypothetical protein
MRAQGLRSSDFTGKEDLKEWVDEQVGFQSQLIVPQDGAIVPAKTTPMMEQAGDALYNHGTKNSHGKKTGSSYKSGRNSARSGGYDYSDDDFSDAYDDKENNSFSSNNQRGISGRNSNKVGGGGLKMKNSARDESWSPERGETRSRRKLF